MLIFALASTGFSWRVRILPTAFACRFGDDINWYHHHHAAEEHATPKINLVHRFDASAILMPRIALRSNRMPSI
jgi:hypothetical protein